MVSLNDGHAPTADYVRKLRAGAAGGVPGGSVLFPARRHGDPDPEFRAHRPDRRAHRRLRSRQESADRQGTAPPHRRASRASSTPICSRKSMPRTFMSRSTARGLCSSASPPATSATTSAPASAPPSRCRQISGPIRPTASPITSRCRRRNIRWARSNDLGNTPVSTATASVTPGRCRANPVPGELQKCRDLHARLGAGQRQPGQHPAGLRGLCQHPGPRPRQHRRPTSTRSPRDFKSSWRPATRSR